MAQSVEGELDVSASESPQSEAILSNAVATNLVPVLGVSIAVIPIPVSATDSEKNEEKPPLSSRWRPHEVFYVSKIGQEEDRNERVASKDFRVVQSLSQSQWRMQG